MMMGLPEPKGTTISSPQRGECSVNPKKPWLKINQFLGDGVEYIA
jgi:hypothetical protein